MVKRKKTSRPIKSVSQYETPIYTSMKYLWYIGLEKSVTTVLILSCQVEMDRRKELGKFKYKNLNAVK